MTDRPRLHGLDDLRRDRKNGGASEARRHARAAVRPVHHVVFRIPAQCLRAGNDRREVLLRADVRDVRELNFARREDVRLVTVAQMEELVARARAALPKDATDEQVKQELESNPEKYPGWKALSSALVKANAELEKQMGTARATALCLQL